MPFKDPERYRKYKREWQRRWRAEHPEENKAQQRLASQRWRAKHPKRNKALAREQSREWRKRHPEKEARNTQIRRARAMATQNTLTEEQAQGLFMIGRATYPGEKLHLDHIVPLSKGGGTTLANMQAIPAGMNLGKSNKLPQEVYRQLGF